MSVNSSIDSEKKKKKKKKKQEKPSIRLHFVYLSIESKVDQKLKIPLSA